MPARYLAYLVLLAFPAGAAADGLASATALPPPPTVQDCAAVAAPHEVAPIVSSDPRPGAPRVFAIQYRQTLANVATYDAFRVKIECLIRADVVPYLATGRPNLVVFDEDTGLATLASGARGGLARALFAQPTSPGCEQEGEPCATLAALAAITVSYAPQLAAYELRFPGGPLGLSAGFLASTDTMARGFVGTFSALAKRYGIYIVASTDIAPFEQVTDPAEVAQFADPTVPRATSAYIATSPDVYNTAFVWGPKDVRSSGPDVLRNVVDSNEKVPVTPLEAELSILPGPTSGPAAIANLEPYSLPGSDARIGIATSLPAFTYGTPPPGVDPCSDVSAYYMRCLDRLGANLVIQDEANPGQWSGDDGDGIEQWQPLSWLGSTYRAVSDSTVHFDYNVTAMMVGNLADLVFDGQSAITQRGGTSGPGCNYVGNDSYVGAEDQAQFEQYAGRKSDFLEIAPWVVADGPRPELRAIGDALAPGSGSPLSDDYVETALVADLPFPPDPRRPGCDGGSVPVRCPTRRIVALVRRGARIVRVQREEPRCGSGRSTPPFA